MLGDGSPNIFLPIWLPKKMDASQEHVEEDNKYAFLLGSALREEDTEQVLKIYDNLIPKNIATERVSLNIFI